MAHLSSAPVALALAVLLSGPAAAQQASAVTQADITRLQDNVYLAERDVSRVEVRDASRARALRTELDDLRDEVIYLKVKLRKEGSLPRGEYTDMRDRIDNLRSRAREDANTTASTVPRSPGVVGTTGSAASTAPRPAQPPAPVPNAPQASTRGTASGASAMEIPAGTEIDVRLQNALNSGTAMVEDRFEGTTLVNLSIDDRVLVPAGSILRGMVSSVEPASRTNRTALITLSFD
jgi:hypothetical protein